ncbi:MAG: 2-C-methyl-D-erythritol 2,4-cyclodiphosphate synthase [Bacilli bacterium]|nr:2-C-methyl-D-erythritol 2,4-cyclodiphosphate synthase [Bacilli bacterium]
MNSGIILMAGKGERSKLSYNKTLYQYLGKPLFMYSVIAFYNNKELDEIYLVIDPSDEEEVLKYLEEYDRVKLVYGASSRAESLKNALKVINADKVVVHDAARPYVTSSDISSVLASLESHDLATLYHKVVDTIKEGVKTLKRDELKAVTTPQGFTKKCIEKILSNGENVYDELQIFENDDVKIAFIEETHNNKKFTDANDFENPKYLIGHSLDFHPLVEGRKLILGGVVFDYPLGLMGHSDADVVYHAVAEAIIGALNMGDIGTLFPDTSDEYKDIDSSYFLKYMKKVLEENNYSINNLDIIIYLEKPNLKNYKRQMAENIAENLGISSDVVNVKATTMEKQGVIGNGHGIASEAVVLLKR